MNISKNEFEFLKGLQKLTKETNVRISGCGCCGSPYLIEETSIDENGGYIINISSGQVEWVDTSDYENNTKELKAAIKKMKTLVLP